MDANPLDPGQKLRLDLVMALLPIASRHEMKNPQEIVAIATELCKYVLESPTDSAPAPKRNGRFQKKLTDNPLE